MRHFASLSALAVVGSAGLLSVLPVGAALAANPTKPSAPQAPVLPRAPVPTQTRTAPQAAQFDAAPTIPGIAVANLQMVMARSKAWIDAEQARKQIFKAQLQGAETRRLRLETELRPLLERYNRDAALQNPNAAALATQRSAIASARASAARDIDSLLEPVRMSEKYATATIRSHLMQAVEAAMAQKGISWLAPMNSLIMGKESYNITSVVLAQLDRLVPSVAVIPPPNWRPAADAPNEP